MNDYNAKPLVIKHRDRFKSWHKNSVFWDLISEPNHPTYQTLKGYITKEEENIEAA